MKFPIDPIHAYSAEMTSPQSELLSYIEKQTYLKTIDPFNLSGHLQGRVLSAISHMIRPQRILEVGTFTAYSAICLAEGLPSEGELYTIEINPEMEYLIKNHLERAPQKDQIRYRIGNAIELIPSLAGAFDLIFIDAAKREYEAYYELCLSRLQQGGFLLIDNVLWKGKILQKKKDPRTKSLDAFNLMLRNDDRVENVLLPMTDGLQIVRKR